MELDLVSLMQQAMLVTLKLTLPVLGVALVTGIVVGLLQAVTQVQEMTLAFVPKILAVMVVLMLTGNWMLRMAVDFTRQVLERISTIGG
jgi:flagellar biosynthetic protein FliQ